MRQSLILSALAATTALLCHSEAKDRPHEEVGIFYVPSDVLKMQAQNLVEGRNFPSPLCPNRLADFLPGELYDMRELFVPDGARFGPNDFVWFNPKRNVVVARAAPADLHFIKTILGAAPDPYHDPLKDVLLDGEIAIGPNRGGKPPSAHIRWQIRGKSGMRVSASALGGSGIGYQIGIEPVIMPYGTTCDCYLDLKVLYEKKEYALMTAAMLTFGKSQTMLLGTAPNGQQVEFRFRVRAIYFNPPESPLKNARWKAGLLKQLRSIPQSAPH